MYENIEEILPDGAVKTKKLLPQVSDAIELTSSVVSDEPLSALERSICELFAQGKSPSLIALDLQVSTQSVNNVLGLKKVKKFLKDVINEQFNVLKEGRLRILNKIINDKLAKLERDNGGDLADSTNKDIVDLMREMDNMLKEREKKELGTNDNTYINILKQVLD